MTTDESADDDSTDPAATFDAVAHYEPDDYPERPLRIELPIPPAVVDDDGSVDSLLETVRFTPRTGVITTDGGTVARDGGRRDDTKDVPMIEEPDERERERAARVWGADRVPREGPIPDPWPWYKPSTEVTLPAWILEIAGRRLQKHDDPDREDALNTLYDYVLVDEDFRTPDGRDAFAVLLGRAIEADRLEDRVVELLERLNGDALTEPELREALDADPDALADALDALQKTERIRVSGEKGGYVKWE